MVQLHFFLSTDKVFEIQSVEGTDASIFTYGMFFFCNVLVMCRKKYRAWVKQYVVNYWYFLSKCQSLKKNRPIKKTFLHMVCLYTKYLSNKWEKRMMDG